MTVQAKDLRINNWVKICFHEKEGWEEVQVTDIHHDNTIDTNSKFETNKYYYEPIELTPEVLIKCGFKQVEGEDNIWEELKLSNFEIVWWISGMYFITTDGFGGDFDFNHATDEDTYWTIHHSVKHLHQLQNLFFSLTGEELIINL